MKEEEYSLKQYFVPFTNVKAVSFISIIGVIVYVNSLFNSPVLDDNRYIFNNLNFRSFNLLSVFTPNIFNTIGQYRALTALFFYLEFQIFHDAIFFFHATQITLHILNTIFLYFVLRRFFKKKFLAFLLSLLFLAHPVQVESVSYVAASGSELFFLFGIFAFLVTTKENINVKHILAVSVLLLLSSLSKETGFLFFIMILFYRFLYRMNIVKIIIGEIIVGIFYLTLRFGIGKVFFHRIEGDPFANLSLILKLVNINAVVFYYLKIFFFPLHLIVNQQWVIRTPDFWNFYFPLIANTVFVCLAIFFGYYIKKWHKEYLKSYLFFCGWFILGMLMISQIFPLDATVADRWFYFPIIGLIGTLGILVNILSQSKENRVLILTLIFSIVLLLSVRTIVRNSNWSDEITLYTHDNKILNNNENESYLGTALFRQKDYENALKHYLFSAKMRGGPQIYYNIANTYVQLYNVKDAEKYYLKAVSYNGDLFSNEDEIKLISYQTLGVLYFQENSFEKMRAIVSNALKKYPKDGSLWGMLTISEFNLGDTRNSKDTLRKAKKFYPKDDDNVVTKNIYFNFVIKQLEGINKRN